MNQVLFPIRSIFCDFASVARILKDRDGEYEKIEKHMRKFRIIPSISQKTGFKYNSFEVMVLQITSAREKSNVCIMK